MISERLVNAVVGLFLVGSLPGCGQTDRKIPWLVDKKCRSFPSFVVVPIYTKEETNGGLAQKS